MKGGIIAIGGHSSGYVALVWWLWPFH